MKEFLDSLYSKTAQKVTWVLRVIEELDLIPVNYLKKISRTEDIWECRAQYGNNAYRILCFFDGNDIVLTNGFLKKTRLTPQIELERAINYKRDYFKRRRNE